MILQNQARLVVGMWLIMVQMVGIGPRTVPVVTARPPRGVQGDGLMRLGGHPLLTEVSPQTVPSTGGMVVLAAEEG